MATADLAATDPRIIEFDVRTDEMLVNMGPQHPSTHGVLRLVLRTDGEVICEATPHIGYLHRCAEKIGENVTPIQFIPYSDRMDYVAAMNMNLGYALAVEKLCRLSVPEKAQVIRVIMAELNRIASHLVAMGTYGLDLGTFSPFLYAFREREMILDLFEEACGAQVDVQLHHHRGRPRRPAGRLGGEVSEVRRLFQAAHRGVSYSPDAQSHFRAADGQGRRPVARPGSFLRLYRPHAARFAGPQPGRSGLGPAQDRAVQWLRNLRLPGRRWAVSRGSRTRW